MKLFDFLKLSEEEQYIATWKKGAYVDLYLKDNIAIELYAINTFYVEIYYERNTTEPNPFKNKFQFLINPK
jgi:hypothetical protein